MLTRIIATLASLVCTITLYLFDQPLAFSNFGEVLSATSRQAIYDKDFKFSGLNEITKSQVLAMLPKDKSIGWWILNTSLIETQLLQNPHIAKASIFRCEHFSWGCFKIIIQEREEAFIMLDGVRQYRVAKDGAIISSSLFSKEDLSELSKNAQRKKSSILTSFPFKEGSSSELIRAGLKNIASLVEMLERHSGYKLEYFEFYPPYEIKVRLYGFTFPIRFDFTPETNEDETSVFIEKIKRFQRLIVEFKERLNLIESIDLGFNKIAVVKLKEGVELSMD